MKMGRRRKMMREMLGERERTVERKNDMKSRAGKRYRVRAKIFRGRECERMDE